SPAPAWLAAIGAPLPREHTQETGTLYYTRFYRLRRGRAPAGSAGLVAGDLGWVKVAIFPGDAGTFSITVGPPAADAALRGLADPRRFERFLRALPGVAPWRAPGVSTPLGGPDGPVLAMGELRNRLRRFVDAEGPLARGFFAIGDAAYHSNPVYGRGCPMALVQAVLLEEAIARHRDDPIAAARYLDRESEAQLRPYWDAAVSADRRALGRPLPRPSRRSAGSSTAACCPPRASIRSSSAGSCARFTCSSGPSGRCSIPSCWRARCRCWGAGWADGSPRPRSPTSEARPPWPRSSAAEATPPSTGARR